MRYIFLAGVVFLGVVAWRVAGSLSADALGMAVGILFGMLSGMPAALLVLTADRRRDDFDQDVDQAFDAGRRAGLLEAEQARALAAPRASAWVVDDWAQIDQGREMVAVKRGQHDRR